MATYSSFDVYGIRFTIEPPIEAGDYTVRSLGTLAVIAARGGQWHSATVEGMAEHVDATIEEMYQHSGHTAMANVAEEVMNRNRAGISYRVTPN